MGLSESGERGKNRVIHELRWHEGSGYRMLTRFAGLIVRRRESMSQMALKLLEQALRLSDQERGDLAARLIDSLDPVPDEDDVESAWELEIQQRIADLDQGRVQPVPWTDARRQILDETHVDAPYTP
jgi:putative addiction module component (TIGR02574 family)